MTSIKILLENKQKELMAKLEADINHPTSKGDNSEGVGLSFLEVFYQANMQSIKGLFSIQLVI